MDYLISILIPIYNVEKYIRRCAISVLEQTYENIEYIFVDDCCTDNSMKILQEVIENYPQRKSQIKVIRHKENRGLATARNTAVNSATGEFLIHVDSDDWIDKNTIVLCVEKQKRQNADIVIYGFQEHYTIEKSILHPLKRGNNESFVAAVLKGHSYPVVWNKLIRTSLYKEHQIRCLDGINMGEDLQVTPLLYYYAKKIEVLEACLYHYNMANSNAYTKSFSVDKKDQAWETIIYISDFFSNKGRNYERLLAISRVNFIARTLVSCARTSNKQYFLILRKRLLKEKKEVFREISLPYRLPLYIHNYTFLHIYSVIMQRLKKIIRQYDKG